MIRALFDGRQDVYALRWESPRSGKTGWSPAVKGGWQHAKASKHRQYLPVTDDVIASHLRGETMVGVYPLQPGDTCRLLACDFDGSTWALDALSFIDACRDLDVPAALERSRSGDGAHVWVFFAEPIPAATARSIGAGLLRHAMARRVEIDLTSYDRLFPSQDFMPKGSFGNLIALPLHGRARHESNTVFLDPASLEPWPDQWAFLSAVHRMSADAARAVSEGLGGFDLGPDIAGWSKYRSAPGPPPPECVRAQLGGQLSIERAGLPPALVAALKHLASLHNPVFYEKQKMRFSTWATPRIIRCYEEEFDRIHLPRGLVEKVERLVHDAGSRLEITDVRQHPAPAEFAFQGTLEPIQQRAVDVLAKHDLGVLVAPPGTGKTVMASALIAHHRAPTLVLCDRQELIEQWRARLGTHLGLTDDQIGQIGGGRTRLSGVVDIATIQSLARRDEPWQAFAGYGLVVVDECHHLPAVSFEASVKRAAVPRWLGLTATPYRRDGLEGILAMQCGPVRHEISIKSTAAALLRLDLVIHETLSDPVPVENPPIQDVLRGIAEDEERNAMVCADVVSAFAERRKCLVLTQRTDQIDRFVSRLTADGVSPLVLKGGLGKRARAIVRDALSEERNDGVVLVATASYLGEGFDWPALDTLFLAFPLAWKGRVVQYVGRLLRAHEGKDEVQVHDYVDVLVPVLARMHQKRLAGYANLGFDVRAARKRRR
ncbi:MAG: DEAD/DEAH box helicase [Actinomycetota bacterium]|nr:DEAD/DEAH box helicase [Actinomycetota bacterium]